jgi:hypothetical protein
MGRDNSALWSSTSAASSSRHSPLALLVPFLIGTFNHILIRCRVGHYPKFPLARTISPEFRNVTLGQSVKSQYFNT